AVVRSPLASSFQPRVGGLRGMGNRYDRIASGADGMRVEERLFRGHRAHHPIRWLTGTARSEVDWFTLGQSFGRNRDAGSAPTGGRAGTGLQVVLIDVGANRLPQGFSRGDVEAPVEPGPDPR